MKKIKDTIFWKIFSIVFNVILGIFTGFIIGALVGMLLSMFYLDIKGVDSAGEAGLGVVVYGGFIGLVSMIPWGILSYLKRNNKRWRRFFLVVSLLFGLPYLLFSGAIFSLIGKIIRLV